MAITIDATVGGASANSFATLAEADSFMESRLNASTWETDASDNDKNRALVEATRWLSHIGWKGQRASEDQALAWPRQWVCDPDSPNGNYVDSDVIPQDIKDGACELAFQFIKAGTTDVAGLDPNIEVQRSQIDVLVTDYVDPAFRARGIDRYPSVKRIVARFMESSGPVVRTVRG